MDANTIKSLRRLGYMECLRDLATWSVGRASGGDTSPALLALGDELVRLGKQIRDDAKGEAA